MPSLKAWLTWKQGDRCTAWREGSSCFEVAISLVRAIITLAHGLNLTVVAEGVETEEQMRLLVDLKCDVIQGFLFFKPLHVDIVGAVLEQNALERNDMTHGVSHGALEATAVENLGAMLV